MAAALTVTPAEIQVGDAVTISGTGFLPSTKVTLTVLETGESSEINTDVAGEFGNSPIPAKAVGLLTAAGNAVAAETVVIGAVTYTWRASVTTTANEVLVGASASASLDNLKAAINADPAGSGTLYGSLTVANPTVRAGVKTATTLALYAVTGGTAGNALATTETMTNASFGGTTLAGGAAATGNAPALFKPQIDQPFDLSATDGTNTATAHVIVSTE